MRGKIFLAVLMLVIFITCISVAQAGSEPTLDEILDHFGFINRTPIDQETFRPGAYEITLYAEFAGYHLENNLSWYAVGSNNYMPIFKGSDGNFGYVNPPITKSFTTTSQFGLSLWSPDGGGIRWFTEKSLNPDGEKHAVIYQSLDDPNLFFIGFENLDGGHSDWDYNDMVVSLKFLPSVGGVWIPINKFQLLAPWIGLVSLMTLTTVVGISAIIKHGKKEQN